MSNFEKVTEFHKVFGHPHPTTPQPDSIKNAELVKLRLSLIKEELKELEQAIEDNNFIEVIDALFDLSYVVNGTGVAFGIDMDKAFEIGHESNMSKLCQTEDEAIKTVESYTALGINTNYRKSNQCDYYVVYHVKTNKILKSINFKLPDFTKMLS